jgi:hypothetical protein
VPPVVARHRLDALSDLRVSVHASNRPWAAPTTTPTSRPRMSRPAGRRARGHLPTRPPASGTSALRPPPPGWQTAVVERRMAQTPQAPLAGGVVAGATAVPSPRGRGGGPSRQACCGSRLLTPVLFSWERVGKGPCHPACLLHCRPTVLPAAGRRRRFQRDRGEHWRRLPACSWKERRRASSTSTRWGHRSASQT